MSLTATYDASLGRVRLSALVPNVSGLEVWVERSTDGVTWTAVRGAAPGVQFGGAFAVDDYEFPDAVAVTYRVRTASGVVLGRDTFTRSSLGAAVATDAFGRTVNFSNNANDTFTRTVVDGWGTATSGQAWSTVSGTAAWADVDGTRGTITHAGTGTTLAQELAVTNTLDGEIVTTITVPVAPAGAGMTSLIRGRSGSGTMVQAVLIWDTAGNLNIELTGNNGSTTLGTVASHLTAVTNVPIKVRFRYADKILRLRVWKSTDAEPTAWSLERADTLTPVAGKVQLASIRQTGNTNADALMAFDDFDLDNFVGGWGNADTGHAWTWNSGGAAAWWSVAGSKGVVTFPTVNVVSQSVLGIAAIQDFEATATFTNPQTLTGGSMYGLLLMRHGSTAQVQVQLQWAVNGDLVVALIANNLATTLATVTLTGVGTAPVKLRFRGVGKELKVKAWTAASEPAAWTAEGTDTLSAQSGTLRVRGYTHTSNTNNVPEMHFDDLVVMPRTAGLGTSDSGHAWQWISGGEVGWWETDGSKAIVTLPTVATLGAQRWLIPDTRDFVVTATVTCPVTPTGASMNAYIMGRADSVGAVQVSLTFLTTGNLTVILRGANNTVELGSVTNALTAVVNVPVKVRFQGIGTAIKVKVWTGATEPAAWTVEATDTVAAVAGKMWLRAQSSGGNTNTQPQVYFDDFDFNAVDPVTKVITPALTTVWLKSVARPFLNRTVTVTDFSDVTRPARGGVIDVLGRRLPVAVTEVRGARQLELTVRATTRAEVDAIALLLSFGDTLHVHAPAACPVPGGHFFVGDVVERRPPKHDSVARYVAMPLVEVDAPDAKIVGATITWAGALSTWATWANLTAARATWLALHDSTSAPADEVVG